MENTNTLYKESSYRAPVQYLISRYIREYDLYRGNISVLLNKGIIDQRRFDYYNSLSRNERQIMIGMMQKDKKIAEAISNGFLEARKFLIEENHLERSDILSIKKDAIYVVDKVPSVLEKGCLRFRCKNEYTSYYLIDKMEFYYGLNTITGEQVLDIKGISDEVLEFHRDGMMQFFITVFYKAQTESALGVLKFLDMIMPMYINRALDISYYREFNSQSKYKIMSPSNLDSYCDYAIMNMPIDITYNYYIMRNIYSLFSSLVFKTK